MLQFCDETINPDYYLAMERCIFTSIFKRRFCLDKYFFTCVNFYLMKYYCTFAQEIFSCNFNAIILHSSLAIALMGAVELLSL